MDLRTFVNEVYTPLRLRGRSPESVRLLLHAVRMFGRWLGRDATLADFDDLTVARFLMFRATNLAPHSVDRERSGLLTLWRFAHDRGLMPRKPCVMPEVIPAKTPRAFTVDELRALMQSASEASGVIGQVRAAAFFGAIVAVGFETGERISALLHTPRDCWREPWLHVPAEVRKGRRVPRDYNLSPEACALLNEASDHDGPTVLHFPCTQTALYKRWHVITKRAGLGDGREVQFHALRRSCASHLAAAGADATAHMGHSSDKITRTSYLDPRVTHADRKQVWQMLPQIIPPRSA